MVPLLQHCQTRQLQRGMQGGQRRHPETNPKHCCCGRTWPLCHDDQQMALPPAQMARAARAPRQTSLRAALARTLRQARRAQRLRSATVGCFCHSTGCYPAAATLEEEGGLPPAVRHEESGTSAECPRRRAPSSPVRLTRASRHPRPHRPTRTNLSRTALRGIAVAQRASAMALLQQDLSGLEAFENGWIGQHRFHGRSPPVLQVSCRKTQRAPHPTQTATHRGQQGDQNTSATEGGEAVRARQAYGGLESAARADGPSRRAAAKTRLANGFLGAVARYGPG